MSLSGYLKRSMEIINIPLLNCDSEKEFRKVFETELVDKGLNLNGYPILIIKNDFDHAFYEKAEGGIEKGRFGIRRAKRMMFIKAICDKKIPFVLLWETKRPNKELCVLCEEAETAIYLRARKSRGRKFFIFKTIIAYGSGIESRIKKQKEQGERITNLEVLFEEAD